MPKTRVIKIRRGHVIKAMMIWIPISVKSSEWVLVLNVSLNVSLVIHL